MAGDLKKFFLKSLLLLLPVAALIFSAFAYVNILNKKAVFQNALENKIYNLLILPEVEKVDLLVMGDSRAERFVDPGVLNKAGVSAINIGIDTSDFLSAKNAAEKYSLLPKTKIVLMSVSFYQLNDGATQAGNTSPATLAQMTLPEMAGVFRKDYGNLIRLYLNTLIESFKPFKFTEEQFEDSGLLKVNKDLPLPIDEGFAKRHGWYVDVNLDGVKWRIFKDFLNYFEGQNVKLVIYDAPVSPAWRQFTQGSAIEVNELEFANKIKKEVEGYKNIYFLDYYSIQPSELTNQDFYDIQHTNAKGAQVFTKMLIKDLREKQLVP